MTGQGLTERHALRVVSMRASSLRYRPALDRNVALREKVPVSDRQPLARPEAANEVWSMGFVFDRSADGRVIKCLTR